MNTMKFSYGKGILSLVLLALVGSCSPVLTPNSTTSLTLQLQVPTESREILPNLPTISTFDLELTSLGQTTINLTGVTLTTVVIPNISLGDWTLKANGYDGGGKLVARGIEPFTLVSTNPISVSVHLYYSITGSGKGSIDLTWDWSNSKFTSNLAKLEIKRPDGTPQSIDLSVTTSIDPVTKYAKYSTKYEALDVPVGVYEINLILKSGTRVDLQHFEMVSVYENLPTQKTLNLWNSRFSSRIINTIAGGWDGFDSDPLKAALGTVSGVTKDAAGNLYFISTTTKPSTCVMKLSTGGVLSVVAGSLSAQGFSGDGGPATQALLSGSSALAFDISGNLLIADSGNHRVRSITPGGIISTIAGNGIASSTGDGGAAVSATMNSPWHLFVDSTGEIYISENAGNRVRKIDTTGQISTFAGTGSFVSTPNTGLEVGDGGLAVNAKLKNPKGVWKSGTDVYIVDRHQSRIRKVDALGIIETVAGNGTTAANANGVSAITQGIGYPSDVWVSPTGDFYFMNTKYNLLNKVTAAGIITTISDNSFKASENFYVVDEAHFYLPGRNAVNYYSSGTTTVVAGGGVGDGKTATQAMFRSPNGLIRDSVGNMYIADYGNNRIRKITKATGLVSTIGGGGTDSTSNGILATNAFMQPLRIALDAVGNIYFSENGNYTRIRKITVATGIINTIAGSNILYASGNTGDGGLAVNALFIDPRGICVAPNGDVYISDIFNHTVRKVTAATGIITTVAGTGTAGNGANGITAITSALDQPYDVKLDATGNLYIADYGNSSIRKVGLDGIVQRFGGFDGWSTSPENILATAMTMYGVKALAFDHLGNLGFSSGAKIRYIDERGIVNTIAGSENGDGDTSTGDGGSVFSANIASGFDLFFGEDAADTSGTIFLIDTRYGTIRKAWYP